MRYGQPSFTSIRKSLFPDSELKFLGRVIPLCKLRAGTSWRGTTVAQTNSIELSLRDSDDKGDYVEV